MLRSLAVAGCIATPITRTFMVVTSCRRVSAVGRDGRARDERRAIGEQPYHGVGDLVGRAQAPDRNAGEDPRPRALEYRRGERRFDEAWTDRVDPQALPDIFGGGAARQADD